METRKAIVYARVSTVEQGKGYSLPTQLESCRAYAQEQTYTVVAEFTDHHTGTELDRPGLNRLRQYVASEEVDVLIVHDLDRLSREPAYQAIIEMELASSGVHVDYVLGQYADSPEGDLTKMIKSAISKYENHQRVERSRRGKIGRARSGYVIATGARAPYGYIYISEPHKGWLIVDETEARVVRQIYTWLLEGQSCYAIARMLYEQHILTRGDLHEAVMKKEQPGAWSPSTVRRIVANETYKGIWYYGKTRRQKVNGKTVQRTTPKEDWIAVDVPAIIDEETWQRAQEMLAKNKQKATRNTRRKYLLRSLVFCRCGRRWTGRYKNLLNRAYYRCPVTEKERWMCSCDIPGGIRHDKLEEAIWHNVSGALLNPENLRVELAQRRTEVAAKMEDKQAEIEVAQKELAEVERKLGILLDEILTLDFPESVVQTRKDVLLARRKQLLAEIERARRESQSPLPSQADEEGLVQFAEGIQASLEHVDFETKHRVLELLQVRVDVVSQKEVKLSALLPFSQDALADYPSDPSGKQSDTLAVSGPVANSSY